MADSQYEAKFQEMQKYLPFLQKIIEELKVANAQQGDNPRETRLQKIERLHEFLANKPKQLKMETLMKFEGILIKLHGTYEKQQDRSRKHQDHRQHRHHDNPGQQLSLDKQKCKENVEKLEVGKSGCTSENLIPQDKNGHQESSKSSRNTTENHHQNTSTDLNSPRSLEREQNLSEVSHTPRQSPKKTISPIPSSGKVVTTESTPVNLKQRIKSSHQHLTQNFKPKEGASLEDKVDHSPELLWEEYNERNINKSTQTALFRLGKKVSKITSVNKVNFPPISISEHCISIQGVSKTPPSTNDINKLFSNSVGYELSNNISKIRNKTPQTPVQPGKHNGSDIIIISSDEEPQTTGNHKQATRDEYKYDNKDLCEKFYKKISETTLSNAEIHEIQRKDRKSQEDNKPEAGTIVNPEEKYQNCADSSKKTEHHCENQLESSCSSTFFTTFKKVSDDNDIATISSYTFSTTFKKEPEDTEPISMTNISSNSTIEANIDVPNDVEQQLMKPNVDRDHMLGKTLTEDSLEITKTKKESIWQTEEREKEPIKEQITKYQTSAVNEDEEKDHIASSSKIMKEKNRTAITVDKIKPKDVGRRRTTMGHSNETNIENSPNHTKKTETAIRRMEAKIDASKPLRVTIKIYATNGDGGKDETEVDCLKSDTAESNGDFNSTPDTDNAATSIQRKLMIDKYYTPFKLLEETNPSIKTASHEKSEAGYRRKLCNKIKQKHKNFQENIGDSEDNSETESEIKNVSTQSEARIVENSIEPKNTNMNWHNQSKYAKLCLICRKKLSPKTSTNHYKMHHGENYISRLAPDLLQKLKQCQFTKLIFGFDKTPKQPSWLYRCPFCLEYLNKPMTAWLKHFQNHTAEFRYKCSQCHKCNNRAYVIRRHIKEHCKGATMVHLHVKQTSSTTINAHVCHLCNFVQLKRTNLDRHYIVQHQFESQNLDLLGYTITLFDAENVEMVEEDEELQAWKSIKSEEWRKGIIEETNELGVIMSTPDTNVENPYPRRKEKLAYEENPLNRIFNTENPDNIACPQTKISQNCRVYNEDFNDYSETDSEMENESLCSESFHQEESKDDEKAIRLKNINIQWHNQSKYTKLCMLCKKKLPGKCSAFHYNMHHGENYISRLAPDVLQQFKKGKIGKPLFGVEKKPPNRPSWFYRCPFCLKYFNTSIPVWLQHFKDHTAEFLFKCSCCHRDNNREDIILRHIKEQCKEETVVRSDVNRSVHTLINAYVCHLCNFLQLKRSNLDRHYLEQHQFEKRNVALLGYTITLFDAKNVEMLPEDKAMEKENEMWKYIKSKEQVRDIREIDEQGNRDITTDKKTINTSKENNDEAAAQKDITVNMHETPTDKKLDKTILNQNKYDDYETAKDTKEPLLLEFSNSMPLKDLSQDGSLISQMEVVETIQIPKISSVRNLATTEGGQFRVAGMSPETLNSIKVFDNTTYLVSSSLPSSSIRRTSTLVVAAKNYEDISNFNQNLQTFTSSTTTGFLNGESSSPNPDDKSRSNPIQDENEHGQILGHSGNAEDGEKEELHVTSTNYLLNYEFNCFHCDFKTQRFDDLKTHYQNVHNSVLETAKSFWYFLYLKSHHFPQVVNAYDNDDLMNFLILGESQNSYQCTLCGEIFPNSVATVQHACNIHAAEEGFSFSQLNNTIIYRCAVCYFTSTNEMDLIRHMIDHYCKFQKCNFCSSLQSSFVGYMQHCYAEHRKDILRFRELYPISQITEYLLNMFIIFPNGLILKKSNVLNTEYGKTEVIKKLYEEMCKISKQPPIPKLSIANLVAQHKINSLSSHHGLKNESKLLESLKAKKILKRRYTVAVNQEDNEFCERKLKLTNEALQKPKKITQRRKTVTIKIEEHQNEFNALPLVEPKYLQ